ncbi:hypothetical protein NH340_JMT08854 [Sarcoptes scabiei]|nr:hypothetical protein NH340_JMT08854 [Sarcoptes scabiei]
MFADVGGGHNGTQVNQFEQGEMITMEENKNRRRKKIQKYLQLKRIFASQTNLNGPRSSSLSRSTIFGRALDFCSYPFYTWFTPVMRKIYRRKLTIEHLGQCPSEESCHLNSTAMIDSWLNAIKLKRNGELRNVSLTRIIFKQFGNRFLLSSFLYIVCLASGYLSSTFFLRELLKQLEQKNRFEVDSSTNLTTISFENPHHNDFDENTNQNYQSKSIELIVAIYSCELIRAIFFSTMFLISIRTSIRCKAALNGLIYHKILSRAYINDEGDNDQDHQNNDNDRKRRQAIQPNNLFAADLERISQMIRLGPLMIGSPIIIMVTIIYTYLLIGYSAIYGTVLFLLLFILQFLMLRGQFVLRKRIVQQTDHRISLITQLVQFILAIKFYSWEDSFKNELHYCREAEISNLKRYRFLDCLVTSLTFLTPTIITIIHILAHTWFDKNITVSEAFSLVMINFIAAHGIHSLPNYYRAIVNGRIAIKRIEKFLLESNDYQSFLEFETKNKENSIEIENGSFTSSDQQTSPCLLKNIQLSLPKNSHLCLYGPFGAGKTALLSSILGQTKCLNGSVRLSNEKIAYVSQNPWLQNISVRENILFGLPFDRKRYYETLMKCSLTEDISLMIDGDETIVGDFGVKLSGGQKHRIALARAVYSNSEIYLIDDCFSSFDSNVLMMIFNNVIYGMLRDKTVIFVSRDLHLLEPQTLVCMMANGTIETFEKHSIMLEKSDKYRQLIEKMKINHRNVSRQKQYVARHDDDEEDQERQFSDLDSYIDYSLDPFSKHKESASCRSDDQSSLNSLISINESEEKSLNNNPLSPKPLGAGKKAKEVTFADSERELRTESKTEQYDRTKKIDFKTFWPPLLRSSKKAKTSRRKKMSINLSVYKNFIRTSGHWSVFLFMIIAFILQVSASFFSSLWLSHWLQQGSGPKLFNESFATKSKEQSLRSISFINKNPNLHFYQLIYLISLMAICLTSIIKIVAFVKIVINVANNIHRKILAKIIHSNIIIIDSISIGKILNLFSHQIDVIDNHLPISLDGFLQRTFLIVGNFIILVFFFHWFLFPLLGFLIVFILIFKYYRKVVSWLKRVDLKLLTPIHEYVNCTIHGLSTIRAFRMQNYFQKQFYTFCDRQNLTSYYSQCAFRWLSIRIDLISIATSLMITTLTVINLPLIGSAYAGFLITKSLQLNNLLQLMIKLILDLERNLISFEQIQEYIELIKTERSISVARGLPAKSLRSLIETWPTNQSISFREVSLRYHDDSPLILSNVSFDIDDGQRFAIVGRTGAGKSSITYALFRLIEIQSGTISIDSINIQTIPIKILRSKLSIIPQDPTIFPRTVRKNLDPRLDRRDEDLWKVIEMVKLKHKIESFPKKLDEVINEKRFSTSEKQLLCLARALLLQNKIIILDEATSSIDDQTETDVWNLLLEHFAHCTIIVIAHRLQTILRCDRLVLIKNGRVIEEGNPIELKNDSDSNFAKMISMKS